MRQNLFLFMATLIVAPIWAQAPTHSPIVIDRDVTGECKTLLGNLPQPPKESSGTFAPDCDSAAFYFGIGRRQDFAAARVCAYVERAHTGNIDSNIFAGSGVLSMVYANGEGTARNVQLARRFTCENDWASPAELSIRLDELAEIEAGKASLHFDLCDTATSGLSEGWCMSIQTRENDAKRDLEINAVVANLTPQAKSAFVTLRSAQTQFEDLRSDNEVDLTGTGRAAFSLEERNKLRDQFLIDLKRVTASSYVAPASLSAADARLNGAYAALRVDAPKAFQSSTITFAGVQQTQRAWLKLRDAWRGYASGVGGRVSPDTIAAQVTLERAHQLHSLDTDD